MKKILFAVLVLLVSVTLAGCQDSDPLFFEMEVVNIHDEVVLSEQIIYEEDDSLNVFDLIDAKVGLDYTVYDIGNFINGVDSYYPTEYQVTYNYYYVVKVNDVVSTETLEEVELVSGMKISFIETTTLDETDLEVDRLIQLFIDNYYATYISDDAVDHYTLAAIKQLDLKGYSVPELSAASLPSSYATMTRDKIADTFKITVLEKAYAQNLDTSKTALSGFESTNSYDAVSLLTALTMTDGSTEQIDTLISTLLTSTPAFMDADYAGMILLALAPYTENSATTQTIDDMVAYIQTMLTETGVESWGNANSSSTATVILGLVAQGINPRGETYQTNDVDLIEALLGYEIDGAYKWQLADDQADMAFSTPQVFSALVAYKIYRDIYGNPAFNLFDF